MRRENHHDDEAAPDRPRWETPRDFSVNPKFRMKASRPSCRIAEGGWLEGCSGETMTQAAPTNDLGIGRPSMKLEAKNSAMPTIRPKTTTDPPETSTGFQRAAAVEDLLRHMPEGSQEELQAMAEVGVSLDDVDFFCLGRGVSRLL